MKKLIEQLAQQRQAEATLKSAVAHTEEKLALCALGLRLATQRECLQERKAETARLEAEVHEVALAAFHDAGTLWPHPAVQVKKHSVLTYNADKALEYAIAHLPSTVTIKLRVRDFEKAARVLPLPFVTKSMEPRVSIARDLSKWIAFGWEAPVEAL